MFENLDDPQPPTPAPIDGVAARGRKLRLHRRMIAGALVGFVLAGTIATAAALQGDGHNKVVVSNEGSTTTSVSDTTEPDATSTTVAETTTTGVSSVVSDVPATTSTTQPPHDPTDLSAVTVSWPADQAALSQGCYAHTGCQNAFSINGNSSLPIHYTVTNEGSWTVVLSECANNTVDVWTTPSTSGVGQYSDGVWPLPYPARGADEQPTTCTHVDTFLRPQETIDRTETIVAGYKNSAGDLMPAPPGTTMFVPSFLPQCGQPCEVTPPISSSVYVFAPQLPETIYTIHLKNPRPSAAAGASVDVEMTYTNALAFTVRMSFFGPCWRVKSGTATADCSGHLPAIVVGPHETVDLVGTLWARKGFVEAGTPLPPGVYAVNLGDQYGTTPSPDLPNTSPNLTVTP
jgi:hypothetical protein